MRAIQITKPGDASVLELKDLPTPTPGAGEALVNLKAAGLNFIDIYIRTGRYVRPLPLIPGLEGAGIVEAVGSGVTEVKPGDRVAYAGPTGSYAEYNVVKAADLIPLPSTISFEQGAAFPLQGMTAHYLLHEYYRVKKGDVVLVHAAAGGVGLLLVQWLKHLQATVIGTVSSEQKAKIAKSAGADHIILYTQEDFVAKSKELTHDAGVNYIIDGVGKSTLPKDLEAARSRGHIVVFGSSSGPADPVSPAALQAKSLTLSTGNLFDYLKTREELLMRAKSVMEGIAQGWLSLKIDHQYPLEKAQEAQEMLEGRNTIGKVILKI
jgi:NADPH2:quinone reductase